MKSQHFEGGPQIVSIRNPFVPPAVPTEMPVAMATVCPGKIHFADRAA